MSFSEKKKYKVHLMGGEGTGWALDSDVQTTRKSLLSLEDLIQFTTISEADVIHTVWEHPLLHLETKELEGKRIICHVCNDLMRTFEQPNMVRASRIGLWVAQSHQAKRDLEKIGYCQFYIPYSIDNEIITEKCPKGHSVQSIKREFNIPEQSFIISNFMRDSLGSDLRQPKEQKGAELFFEIVQRLFRKGLPIHVLIAGPRRHWLRNKFIQNHIPYTFIGKEIDSDDNSLNILPLEKINLLYHVSDLHLITSRWEGGPRSVLEAALTRTPVVSTPVGMVPDILEANCLFSAVDEGAAIIENHLNSGILDCTLDIHLDRIYANHLPETNVSLFRKLYENINNVPYFERESEEERSRIVIKPTINPIARFFRHKRPGTGLRVGLWHQFQKPPYGGGNQFMLALKHALQKQGVRVDTNRFSDSIQVHLCNSAWFAVDEFIESARFSKKTMIHRVDGPIAIYRGQDWTEDNKIYDLNARLASATVYQSGWCFSKLHELGFRAKSPVIIHNAVDDRIFNSKKRIKFSKNRKIRLVATAWSDNPKKGGPFFKWLEKHLDWELFDFTFVGRTHEKFDKIQHIPPQPSKALAEILRDHDIYLMASQHEACSNALLEALACGLPVLYLADGSNGELTQMGGLPYHSKDDAIGQLMRLVESHGAFQDAITVRNINDIALKYITLFKEVLDS